MEKCCSCTGGCWPCCARSIGWLDMASWGISSSTSANVSADFRPPPRNMREPVLDAARDPTDMDPPGAARLFARHEHARTRLAQCCHSPLAAAGRPWRRLVSEWRIPFNRPALGGDELLYARHAAEGGALSG